MCCNSLKQVGFIDEPVGVRVTPLVLTPRITGSSPLEYRLSKRQDVFTDKIDRLSGVFRLKTPLF